MIITKETKERFVKMLMKRQIVVIWSKVSKNSSNKNYKFIGMQNGMKWDFTPTIADATKCKTNGGTGYRIAARAYSSSWLVEQTLKSFKEEGIKISKEVLNNAEDYLVHFGM